MDPQHTRNMLMESPDSAGKYAWTDIFYVEYESREFLVGRRPGQSNFSLRLERNRKAIVRSLGTPDRKTATKNAGFKLKQIFGEDWEAIEKKAKDDKKAFATIGEVCSAYSAVAAKALRIQAATVKDNTDGLKLLVRYAHATFAPKTDKILLQAKADKISTLELTGALVRKFVMNGRRANLSEVTLLGTIRKARSVFQPAALDFYEGLHLPDLRPFREQGVKLKLPDQSFIPFRDGEEHGMEKGIEESRKLALNAADRGTRRRHRNRWLCYMLMGRLGSRNIEVEFARWTWFRTIQTPAGERIVFDVIDRPDEGFEVKNAVQRVLSVDPDLWAQILEVRGDVAPDDFVIEAGSARGRWEVTHNEINDFVRIYIPNRTKGAYELRKWAGSIVLSRAYEEGRDALAAAKVFLGHSNEQTTEAHYAKLLCQIAGVSNVDALRYVSNSTIAIGSR